MHSKTQFELVVQTHTPNLIAEGDNKTECTCLVPSLSGPIEKRQNHRQAGLLIFPLFLSFFLSNITNNGSAAARHFV